MIVLDSSFLVAAHNRRDAHHQAARDALGRFLEGEWGRGLLPEYVFQELVTVLGARLSLTAAVEVADLLLEAQELEIVPCSPLFRQTLATFREQERMRLSFVDAAIVAVARVHGAEHVATFDRDFRDVPGLTVVPPPG